MYRIFTIIALLAVANAADHQATSFVSFNDNHNSVHHIHSAPGPSLVKYAAPAAPVYAPALTKVALPVAGPPPSSYYNAPAPIRYSAPATSVYAAPAIAKVALPVVTKQLIAPVTKYVAAPAYSSPAYSAPAYAQREEDYGPAQYEFAYAIQDPHTGDFHCQQEHRDGHHVVGQYSLHEADGTVRIVKYSDEGHGFNAVVERQGHPTEAPSVAYKKVLAVASPHYH